ncbi:unnamed protein product, partial [Discosporangium mesarthrocarpum]
MRCIWLTRYAPYPPEYGGDVIYSARLIEQLAQHTDHLLVVCHPRHPESMPTPDVQSNIRWAAVNPN